MNTRRLLIAKADVNYAASKTDSTAATATNFNDLAEGALGLFYFDGTDWDLVDGSNPSGGKTITYMPELCIVQGVAEGDEPVVVKIPGAGLQIYSGKSYLAPVKQVIHIGYNGSAGAGIVVANSTDYITKIYDRSGQQLPRVPKDSSVITSAASGNSIYSIAQQIVEDINGKEDAKFPMAAEVVGNGTMADFTGTATAIKFTKGSTTARFMIQDATSGWVASTGSFTDGDLIGVAHSGMTSVTFTANILGTGAGRHIVTIGNTIYNVADAGSAAQNATAIAAAINAGTQANATVSTADVTIVLKNSSTGEKILVVYSADDSAWSVATLTVNATLGGTAMRQFKVDGTVAAAATFELDREAEFDGYFLGGSTATLHTGGVSSNTIAGIRLIHDVAGDVADIALDGGLSGLGRYKTTNPHKGSGTYAEVLDAEYDAQHRSVGYFHPGAPFVERPPVYSVSGEIYDILTLTFTNQREDNSAQHGVTNFLIHAQIAIPESEAGMGNFLTYLNTWAASAPKAFPSVSV